MAPSAEAMAAGMLDGAPEDSGGAGLLLALPRLGLLVRLEPSPHVQTEMKAPVR